MNVLNGASLQLATELKEKGITNQLVLNGISLTQRDEFVSSGFRTRAWENEALPIECGQTISQPYTVAWMTQLLEPYEGMKVLEIGTGSGYQAAVLYNMGIRVWSVERIADLLANARKTFDRLGYNIATHLGDGTLGWSTFAPYDGILVTAGAPDVPQSLMRQLTVGGRLVIPVGDKSVQRLQVIQRVSEDEYEVQDRGEFRFVPLIGRRGWIDEKKN